VIPFNKPAVTGCELTYVARALETNHISGDGSFTRRCHDLLAQLTGGRRVLLTTSCTHALEIAALLLDIQPGDEVIVPSFAFVSVANAFVLRGARPIFVDVRPDTFNIDESRIADAITPRTRAIILLHYGGVACAMDQIGAVADRQGLAIVEDNAHGLFGAYRGRPLGCFGTVSTLSFHETKNITCGEGGALVLNDSSLEERAEIIREKGTNRSRFFRGQVDRYTWVDVGSSYLPSDLLAAYLCAQLEEHQRIQQRRLDIWRTYASGLCAWASAEGVQLPVVPDECEHPAHLFYLLMPTLESRTALIHWMRNHEIHLAFHYQALHLSTMGQRFGGYAGQCPVSESAADRLVRLPLYYGLTECEQSRVIETLLAFRCD
jgi:dTDP-4-amino-4,6-dideoxygalactose transaminase